MGSISNIIKFAFDHSFAAFIKADSPASISRYMLTIEFFTMLLGYWFVAANPPDSLIAVFYATLAYVFGDKFTPVIKDKLSTVTKKNATADAQGSVTTEKEPSSI